MKKITIVLIGAVLCTVCPAAVLWAQEGTPSFTYTLNECIDIALERSPEVLSAAGEVRRTGGVLWEVWADIVSVSISAGYTDTSPGRDLAESLAREDFSTTIAGSLPIFSGGRVINGVLAAYLERDIAREQYRKAVSGTVYNVRKAFWRILLDRESVRVQKENVDFLEKTRETIQGKYEVGMASWFELLRAEVELANARPSLMEAEDSLSADTDNLKRLMGMDVDEALEVNGGLAFEEIHVTLEGSLSRALSDNPDILIAALSEDVARKKVSSTIGEYFPTVSIFGRYVYDSDTVEVTFDDDRWETVAGVTITMPISELFSTTARLKQALAERDKAAVARADTENGVKLEVKNAFRDLARSKKLVESQRENIKLAEEGLEIAEIQYENGINTYLELMDTRLALTQANLNYINAVYTYLEAASRIEKLTGVGGTIGEPSTTDTPHPGVIQ